MRRIAALGIVLLAGWVAHRGAPAGGPVSSAVPFAMGFALIAAVLAGELVERLSLPRVSGYLLLGLVCGPYVANLITAPMAREPTVKSIWPLTSGRLIERSPRCCRAQAFP